MKHEFYVSPVVEIMDVEVEKGFAASTDAQTGDWMRDDISSAGGDVNAVISNLQNLW